MATEDRLTAKEYKLFLAAIGAGISGGFFANLFTAFLIEIIHLSPYSFWIIVAGFIISLLAFVGILLWLVSKIEKTQP
jgi:hypothetical protein